MFDQLFEGLRKASESTAQAQQDVLKQWLQQFSWMPAGVHPLAGGWDAAKQKRWAEAATEALEKHRELLDLSYRSGIRIIEQALRATDAKSPEESRRLTEELVRKLTEAFKEQSEVQFRELQRIAESWAEFAQGVPV